MFHVSRETFFFFTENCFPVKQKTKVKTEKIIEKITFISTWIYWK